MIEPTSPASPPDVVTTLDVVYAVRPGFRPLALDLYRPTGTAVALCVYAHGGGWRMGSRRDGPGPVGPTSVRFFRRMAERGLAVASIDYRLSGEAQHPAQIDDLAAACAFLRDRGADHGVAGLPLVVWGASAGGHLAALAGLGAVADVAAVACWSAPTDLPALADDLDAIGETGDRTAASREALLIGAALDTAVEKAHAASPIMHVGATATPFRLVHGTADRHVPIAQSERFAARLAAGDVPAQLVAVDGGDHFSSTIGEQRLGELVDATIEFLVATATSPSGKPAT